MSLSWAVVILVLSVMPGQQLPSVEWLWSADKWAHAAVYGILAWLLFNALSRHYPAGLPVFGRALILAGGYGLLLEVIQYLFFPGRYFELGDAIANIFGILVAIFLRKLFN